MDREITYKEVKTFTFPDAIVRVHIPELTPEEREIRQKILHDAAASIIIAAMKASQKNEV